MDDPQLDPAEHRLALRGLERVQRLSGTAGRMWKAIRQWGDAQRSSRLTVMDVGCGNAMLLRNLWIKAHRQGVPLKLIGCDISPHALELAKVACAAQQIPIQLHQLDVTRDAFPVQADVVTSSLFLHHFASQQAAEILKRFATAASRLVLIEDLIRSPLGYALCLAGVHMLTRSRVVHFDGPQSVRAAFTLAETRELLQAARWQGATIHRCWPERLFVTYRRGNDALEIAHA